MTTPTPIKELCAKATKGPWTPSEYHAGDKELTILAPGVSINYDDVDEIEQLANAALISRLDPQTVLAIYEAAEHIDLNFTRLASSESNFVGDDEHESWAAAKKIKRLLNGEKDV